MKPDLIPFPDYEEKKAWSLFPRAPMQTVLHNELVKKIELLRDQMEGADANDVLSIQMQIQAHREFLGMIHRHDKLPTK